MSCRTLAAVTQFHFPSGQSAGSRKVHVALRCRPVNFKACDRSKLKLPLHCRIMTNTAQPVGQPGYMDASAGSYPPFKPSEEAGLGATPTLADLQSLDSRGVAKGNTAKARTRPRLLVSPREGSALQVLSKIKLHQQQKMLGGPSFSCGKAAQSGTPSSQQHRHR